MTTTQIRPPTPTESALDRGRGFLVTMVLAIATIGFALSQTALLPAIGRLASVYRVSSEQATWMLTGYLLSAAVLTPVAGRLGDQFGRRRILMAVLLLFAVGGLIAGASDQFGLAITGRVIQGAGGGVFPLCYAVVRDELAPARRASAIGLVSALAGIGGGLGLLFGGLLAEDGWYLGFLCLVWAIAVVPAIAARFVLRPSLEAPSGRIDAAGTVLLGAGITLPLLAASEATAWRWLAAVIAGVGALVLGVFVAVERRSPSPLVDLQAFVRPRILLVNAATILVGFAMFAAFLLVPQLASAAPSSGYGWNATAVSSALPLLPGCLVMLLAGPLAGVWARRYPALPLIIGTTLTTVGLGLLAAWHGGAMPVTIGSTVLLFGIGLCFAATPNLIVLEVPESQTGQATGINTLLRSVGSSLGAQLIAVVLASLATHAGLASNAGYTLGFAVASAAAAVALILALLLRRTSAALSLN
jgi:MFS family permease